MRFFLFAPALVAAGLLLGQGAARAQDAPAPAAAAANKDTVRAEVGTPLQAAQALMKERKFKDALAKIKEAEAVANRTPFENFIIDRMRGSAAANSGDDEIAATSFEAVVASGRLPASEQVKVEQAVAGTWFKLKNYGKAAAWAARYYRDGGTEASVRDILINAKYLENDFAGAAAELAALVDADEKAARVPTELHLQMLLSCYLKLNNGAGLSATLEKLLETHPKKEYWAQAISHLARRPGFAERLELDLLRLRAALGDLRRESDYMELAQLDLEAGFPAEAKKFFDQGYASGVLGKGTEVERQKRLQNKVNRDAADDLKSLGQGDSDAEKAKTGDGLINAGYNYVINGKYPTGLAMVEQGLHKGGLKHPEDAKLHAGIAFLLAGDKTKAIQILHTVQGNDGAADLAHLWALYAAR